VGEPLLVSTFVVQGVLVAWVEVIEPCVVKVSIEAASHEASKNIQIILITVKF
jgi:hypothetical protein